MEKFAVDIEKVLNDFEYNEEQLSKYSNTNGVNNSYDCGFQLSSSHFLPSVATFDCSRFESPEPAEPNLLSEDQNLLVEKSTTSDSFRNSSSSFEHIETAMSPSDHVENLIEYSNSSANIEPDVIKLIETSLPDVADTGDRIAFDLISDSGAPMVAFPTNINVTEDELSRYLDSLVDDEVGEDNATTKPDDMVSADDVREASEENNVRTDVSDMLMKNDTMSLVDHLPTTMTLNNDLVPVDDVRDAAPEDNVGDSAKAEGASEMNEIEEKEDNSEMLIDIVDQSHKCINSAVFQAEPVERSCEVYVQDGKWNVDERGPQLGSSMLIKNITHGTPYESFPLLGGRRPLTCEKIAKRAELKLKEPEGHIATIELNNKVYQHIEKTTQPEHKVSLESTTEPKNKLFEKLEARTELRNKYVKFEPIIMAHYDQEARTEPMLDTSEKKEATVLKQNRNEKLEAEAELKHNGCEIQNAAELMYNAVTEPVHSICERQETATVSMHCAYEVQEATREILPNTHVTQQTASTLIHSVNEEQGATSEPTPTACDTQEAITELYHNECEGQATSEPIHNITESQEATEELLGSETQEATTELYHNACERQEATSEPILSVYESQEITSELSHNTYERQETPAKPKLEVPDNDSPIEEDESSEDDDSSEDEACYPLEEIPEIKIPPPILLDERQEILRDRYQNAQEETDSMDSSSTVEAMDAHRPKPQRPDTLAVAPQATQVAAESSNSTDSGSLISSDERKLGKERPFWIPDSETTVCMHCQIKFTLVKRRHHCRACGLVLCSKCCDMKASLEYLGFEEVRVCRNCHDILERINSLDNENPSAKQPNPNNPMEYCSTISPLLQAGPSHRPPPSVLVPVGVLKREGKPKTDTPKQVMFSDGIRPGGDLTEGESLTARSSLNRSTRIMKRVGTPPGNLTHRRPLNRETGSFIPSGNDLPPLVTKSRGEYIFRELEKPITVDDEPLQFAINWNLFVILKRVVLDCCVNKDVWCITSEGLSCVGQDEVIFIVEVLEGEKYPPKDLFITVNMLYQEGAKGTTVTEMTFSALNCNNLFGAKDLGGFIFIRPTYQCVQKLVLPKPPYLVGLLIHKWEAAWARLFPIRLVLRFGAEYRYYPCPLVSVRSRPPLYTDLGHTIMSLLADFRNFSYTLPAVRGLIIHMEDRSTTVLLPRNRYDQVVRAINNSEENVLSFAGNVSPTADSHLVCIQSPEDSSYHTQAINIHGKPRHVTGASFIVFNGSLKQCGYIGKSNIVEDGLMVQIPSDHMASLRNHLKQMKDFSIGCGPQSEEIVQLKWTSDDLNYNIGVVSNIDKSPLNGIRSIRVHNGTDYTGSLRMIRWTEVFILQSDETENSRANNDAVNVSKISESIARATCKALVPLLDLLAAADLTTLAVRATIHPDDVGYEAGSKGERLPPLYMKSLDEELIVVVHKAALMAQDASSPIVLELIFKVMEHCDYLSNRFV